MKRYFAPLTLLLVLGIAAVFLPYRAWLEKRLEIILEAKGFENVALTISSVGLNSASLENVSIGGENKLGVKNIVLGYSLRDLWNGYLRDLTIAGVAVDVKQEDGRWVVSGLEGLSAAPESNVSEPLAVPLTSDQLARIPFERITLEDSLVNIFFGEGKLSLPLDLSWQKSPQSRFTYKGEDLAFQFGALEAAAKTLTLDASIAANNSEWSGPWELQALTLQGTSIPVPVMTGAGTLSLNQARTDIQGTLTSDDKLWHADFAVNYDFAAAEKSNLTILQAGMPWKEGRIDVRTVKIPLSGKDPIKMTLHIEKVSVQELMESLTGDRIAATGKVSGALPLIIGRDGKITILPGNLQSEGPGTISMPPEVIPGNNEQVALVRQILEDLNYTGLSITLKNDDSGRLGILMSFEGNNPDVYNGRPVKLNVNLTGDVIEFIQQNVLLLTSPEQFIKQERDEKN
jgi:hypothetical protein